MNLVFNLNFRRPIEITEEGIFATLAFDGRPYPCILPFDAVWAIYDPNMKNGQVWEESMPKDMNLAERVMGTEPQKPPEKLKPVKSSGKPSSGAQTKGKRDRRPLRVIK